VGQVNVPVVKLPETGVPNVGETSPRLDIAGKLFPNVMAVDPNVMGAAKLASNSDKGIEPIAFENT
jgi:hypothetical protein